jgi:hypothetical protein
MRNIILGSREEVVDADDFITKLNQPITPH